ncbi:NACHT domain-containing protein [Streptomyces niveus]|uniref:NACHT domain-containing protein n=1 Tax=Streptomyces niveus TaxID=193462 RepID=UPI000B184294|nr:ATP-binding protein [Streptomyces niveus]
MSELLNGRRSTPPKLDDILLILACCRASVGGHPPPGLSLDPGWWRTRLSELEATTEAQRRIAAPRVQTRESGAAETAGVQRIERVTFDFAGAVEILIGERGGFDDLVQETLEPLNLLGNASVSLRGLFEGFGARVRASRGTTRTALLCAADVVLLVSAFSSAVAEQGIVAGPEAGDGTGDVVTQVLEELGRIELGSARVRDSAELREEISAAYSSAVDVVYSLGNPFEYEPERLARLAWRRYEALLAPVTWDCPELRLTSETYDPDQELGRPPTTSDRVGLVELGSLFAEFACTGPVSAQQRERMRAPIASAEGSGPTIPSLEAGYVDPAFRVARHSIGRQLTAENWWQQQPLREDLAGFLGAYLITHQATQAPLLIFGHPGSGKSSLTKLMAARLPEAEYFSLRVELRHTPVDLDLQEQLELALFHSTGHRTAWPDAAGAGSEVTRVVLLDGFDELLQAGGDFIDMAQQWRYLKDIEQFQQRESELGRVTVFIVTSRTVVADQVFTPAASTVIRVEPFDDTRIIRWLEVWEVANRRYFAVHGLEPPTWQVVRPHLDLARQPLLLLMLALYDGVDNPLRRLGAHSVRRVDLYERLLKEFVRRQVVKKSGILPSAVEEDSVERELRRLSVIAIGMFNRRRQSITESDADKDLEALLDGDGSTLLFGRFFFVHESQTVVAAEEVRSYEFLHATFGEYLVARLIGAELQAVLDEWEAQSSELVNDTRLYALLSFVPLTDDAEVLRNAGELREITVTSEGNALPKLLRVLFSQAYQDGRRPRQSYQPIDRKSIERDATYTANLLLLAVLAEGSVSVSDFFATSAPIETWWRCVQIWRSQFGENAWEVFTGTLLLEDRAIGLDLERSWDICVKIRGVGMASAESLSWALRLSSLGPTSYHDSKGVNPANLIRRLSFVHDAEVHQLLHALFPLIEEMPNALRTYRIDENQQAFSAAHVLVAMLCRRAGDSEGQARRYLDVLSVLRSLPKGERMSVADILTRNVVHDAALLPESVLLPILLELIRLWSTEPGELPVQAWNLLQSYVKSQMERADLPEKERVTLVSSLVGHLHGYATRFRNSPTPEDRLMQTLREAETTHVWELAGRGSGLEVLNDGLSILDATSVAEPDAVIGLLRLARELGERDWLAEHASSMLSRLPVRALKRLRPSDVDSVRGLVHDAELLAALNEIERIWRGPSPSSI